MITDQASAGADIAIPSAAWAQLDTRDRARLAHIAWVLKNNWQSARVLEALNALLTAHGVIYSGTGQLLPGASMALVLLEELDSAAMRTAQRETIALACFDAISKGLAS